MFLLIQSLLKLCKYLYKVTFVFLTCSFWQLMNVCNNDMCKLIQFINIWKKYWFSGLLVPTVEAVSTNETNSLATRDQWAGRKNELREAKCGKPIVQTAWQLSTLRYEWVDFNLQMWRKSIKTDGVQFDIKSIIFQLHRINVVIGLILIVRNIWYNINPRSFNLGMCQIQSSKLYYYC